MATIWKLLRGISVDKTFKPVRLREEEVEGGRGENHYYPGDIFSSEKDLTLCNLGNRRFERLPDEALDSEETEEEPENEFSGMTVSALKTMAEELEVDLDGASKKQEIIDLLTRATA